MRYLQYIVVFLCLLYCGHFVADAVMVKGAKITVRTVITVPSATYHFIRVSFAKFVGLTDPELVLIYTSYVNSSHRDVSFLFDKTLVSDDYANNINAFHVQISRFIKQLDIVSLSVVKEQNIPDTCFNGILDETESDLDCGNYCKSCAHSAKCNVNLDCLGNLCKDGVCVDVTSPLNAIAASITALTTPNTTITYTIEVVSYPVQKSSAMPFITFDNHAALPDSPPLSCTRPSYIGAADPTMYRVKDTTSIIALNSDVTSIPEKFVCVYTSPSSQTPLAKVIFEYHVNANILAIATETHFGVDGGFGFVPTIETNSVCGAPVNLNIALNGPYFKPGISIVFNLEYEAAYMYCEQSGAQRVVPSRVGFVYTVPVLTTGMDYIIKCVYANPDSPRLLGTLSLNVLNEAGVEVSRATVARGAVTSAVMVKICDVQFDSRQPLTANELIFLKYKVADYFSVADVADVSVYSYKQSSNQPSVITFKFDSLLSKLPTRSIIIAFRTRVELSIKTISNVMATPSSGYVPNTCFNGQLDGEETDIDCGGPECPLCQSGLSCFSNADCLSNECVPSLGWICADSDPSQFVAFIVRHENGINPGIVFPDSPIRYYLEAHAIPTLNSKLLFVNYEHTGLALPIRADKNCVDSRGAGMHLIFDSNNREIRVDLEYPITYNMTQIVCNFKTSLTNNPAIKFYVEVYDLQDAWNIMGIGYFESHVVSGSYNQLGFEIEQVYSYNTAMKLTFTPQSLEVLEPFSSILYYPNYESTSVKCHDHDNTTLTVTRFCNRPPSENFCGYNVTISREIAVKPLPIHCIMNTPPEGTSVTVLNVIAIWYRNNKSIFARAINTQAPIALFRSLPTIGVSVNGTAFTDNEIIFITHQMSALWNVSTTSVIVASQEAQTAFGAVTLWFHILPWMQPAQSVVQPANLDRRILEVRLGSHLPRYSKVAVHFEVFDVADTCFNKERDFDESDIDCGGVGTCPACVNAQACYTDLDCVSNKCALVDDVYRCVPKDTTPMFSVSMTSTPVTLPNHTVHYTLEVNAVPPITGAVIQYNYVMTGITTPHDQTTCVDAYGANTLVSTVSALSPTDVTIQVNRPITEVTANIVCTYTTPFLNWDATTIAVRLLSLRDKSPLAASTMTLMTVASGYTFTVSSTFVSQPNSPLALTFTTTSNTIITEGVRVVLDLGYVSSSFACNNSKQYPLPVTRQHTVYTVEYAVPITFGSAPFVCALFTPTVSMQSHTVSAYMQRITDGVTLLTASTDLADVIVEKDISPSHFIIVRPPTTKSLHTNSDYPITFEFVSYPQQNHAYISFNLTALSLTYLHCSSELLFSSEYRVVSETTMFNINVNSHVGSVTCLFKTSTIPRSPTSTLVTYSQIAQKPLTSTTLHLPAVMHHVS